jgi:hypothetical protein
MNNSALSPLLQSLEKMSLIPAKKRASQASAFFPMLLTNTEMYFINSLHPRLLLLFFSKNERTAAWQNGNDEGSPEQNQQTTFGKTWSRHESAAISHPS